MGLGKVIIRMRGGGTGSGSCQMAGLGIGGHVERLGCTNTDVASYVSM